MFRIIKKFRFEAAHRLPLHDGKCQRLHGHSWNGSVTIESDRLHSDGSNTGMVMDFGDIKRILDPIVDQFLDHHYLNDSLQMEAPTSELIAHWLFRLLDRKIEGLVSVRIEETCTSAAEYTE